MLGAGEAAVRADDLKGVVVAVAGGAPGDAFFQAVRATGASAAGGRGFDGGTGILFYDSFSNPSGDPTAAAREKMQAILNRGGSVVFLLSGRVAGLKPFEDLMPLTPWAAQDNCRRPGAGAVAPEGSPLAGIVDAPAPLLSLSWRFDLHLPYSTLETGQQRYEWARLGKPLLNTDWRVLLASDQDGRLPLLVEGRCGPGRVFVFAGDLYAPEMKAEAGFAPFLKAFVAYARPLPVPATGGAAAVAGLSLAVPKVQPSGEIVAEVTNPSSTEVVAVLACKVRNTMRGMMNSFSTEITVPAGKTLRVPLPESDPQRAASAAPVAADGAAPFRWVEVGLAAPDRQAVSVSQTVLVDRTPAVTVSAGGEDVRRFPDTDGWPAGGSDFLPGNGMPLDRYVYACGESPKVTVRLGNGFHNIAPLAMASDAGWPENPSVQGLNDGSYSYGDIRGKYPLTGFWIGRNGGAEQHLRLAWDRPVILSRQGLVAQTAYRRWDRTNPSRYALSVDGGKAPVVAVENAGYEFGRRQDDFPPQTASACALDLSGLDPKLDGEPRANGLGGNCALGEWEVYGWPDKNPPPAVRGTLTVTVRDLSADTAKTVLEKQVALAPVTESSFAVEVPSLSHFGQATVHVEFHPEGGAAASCDLPFLFVPKGAPHLVSRDELGEVQAGLLCSPGFTAIDDFGLGTNDATQGWGGADDQSWAWAHDLMEMGSRSKEAAQRFLMSPAGITHYTDPWRDFPSGRYVWDWVTDRLVEKFTTGAWKGKKSIHIVLSDRWNGIAIGSAFAWDDFIRFDEALRAAGKPGLAGRTRAELCDEITGKHADEFQRFELNRYADGLLRSQKRLADIGVRFTTETHGSFPLAGGELGAKLAQADIAVGTDLFWALMDEDPYKTVGYRYGLVAANPDLESGAYDQWGWVNAALANATWFTPSGDAEPSRRQWYISSWTGRVTSDGSFKPYTIYGFSTQGGYGVKNTLADWDEFNRVQTTMIRVRPDKACGFGVVASWQLQENRMGPAASTLGFGLYAAKGYEQVDAAVGEAYQRLMKNGVPVSFVASTYTLRKWNGTQPLVAVDGFEADPWEIAEFDRLNKAGAPILAIGSENRAGRAEAEALFGVKRSDAGWVAQPGTEEVKDASGATLGYVCRRPGRAPTLFCPASVSSMGGPQSAQLSALCLQLAGQPVTLPPGVSATPFSSNGSLFLALGSLSDASRTVGVVVQPSLLDASFKGKAFRVIDCDAGTVVPARWDQGALRFQIPCGPNDGRLIQILPL